MEISVTESEEVLVARIASGETISSSRRKMSFLSSSCSTIASTTKSASARSLSVGGEGDPVEQLLLLVLGQLAALDRAPGGVLEVLATALEAPRR